MEIEPDLLTAKQASIFLGICYTKFRTSFRLLGIPVVNLKVRGQKNNQYRFRKKDLEKWIERRKEGGYVCQ